MITTVTLNASIDKAYHMDAPNRGGEVARVKRTVNSAGGKGLNVARIIKLLGGEVNVTGLQGGFNGQYLKALAREDGLLEDFFEIKGETRSCINILDPVFKSTEYLEAGPEVTLDEEERFKEFFKTAIQKSGVVTLSGSLPSGMSKSAYAHLIEEAKKAGKTVILDTSGEALEKSLGAGPDFIKPNKEEIEALTGLKMKNTEDLIEAACKLREKGALNVLISLGGDGAVLITEDQVYKMDPPSVAVKNTVGCGDSMVGALAYALDQGLGKKEALRFAGAVGAANAKEEKTGYVNAEELPGLIQRTKVRVIQ